MIDARRWVLVEAWLALGLRIEWAPSWETIPSGDWQDDEGQRFYYEGRRTWRVMSSGHGHVKRTDHPSLSVESMAHELAHYLVATAEQRQQRNFGLHSADLTSDGEDRAVDAEAAIHAVLAGANHIAQLALKGGR